MEPISCGLQITLNEQWFMHYFEKVIKRHVEDQEKVSLILIDLQCVLRDVNDS